MRTLPEEMIRALAPFAPLFSKRLWRHVQVLVAGAILAPGARTVSSALRAMGLDQQKRFHRYHRVLSRARWSSIKASRVLLGLLVEMFVPEGDPLVVGIDETLERRYGRKISARGVYRDPVRSTHDTFVKSSGLRWVCVMLLVEVPWASRVWALPFLSALAPSERYAAKRGRRHKKITEWAWQLLLLLRRWYPQREIVAVADRAYASLKLLSRCRSLSKPVTFITRLRLDAALYEPAPPRRPGQIGRPRIKGERLPNLSVVAEEPNTVWKPTTITNWYGSAERRVEIASKTAVWYSTGLFAVPLRWVLVRDPEGEFKTQAILCTDLDADPQKILCWFVMRWQLEVLGELKKVAPLLLAAGLAAVTALGLASAASAATFSNNEGITINDGSQFCHNFGVATAVGTAAPYPSVIAVSGLGSSVTDVNVTVSGLSHTWPDDVGLLLVSPTGQSVILMTDSGGDFDHPASGINLTFDDAASGPAPDNTKLKSRIYLPSRGTTTATPPADCVAPARFPAPAPDSPYGTSLSVFKNTNPNGDWKLYVIDDSAIHIGSITSWSLDISTTPVPTTKEQCKNGGWREFGYPNQGTCISDVNRRNR